jgi:aryl-alcohol dehydrogenase-like predicted oxidoreductase
VESVAEALSLPRGSESCSATPIGSLVRSVPIVRCAVGSVNPDYGLQERQITPILTLKMNSRETITRRELLQRLALLTGATLVPWRAFGALEAAPSDKLGPVLPYRTLGKTGLKVTMLAVGGSHVGRPSESVAQAVVEAAIENGIRTFDTAQLYQNGGSEERYGKFLTPKYREHVLIFTKTMAEDAATARSHLEGSLRRMKTDYLDLWQLHDLRTIDKATDRVHGVLDVMLKAKADGKVRHIGFTGHGSWKTHAHVLGLTDAFETCLMPINIADPSYESFTLNVLPILVQRNMGAMAMKTLAADGLMGGRDKSGPPFRERGLALRLVAADLHARFGHGQRRSSQGQCGVRPEFHCDVGDGASDADRQGRRCRADRRNGARLQGPDRELAVTASHFGPSTGVSAIALGAAPVAMRERDRLLTRP